MANKPNIRFKGFTDDWEQRKLGDILERRIEQRRQSADYPRLAFASGQGVIPLSERKTNNREQLTKDEFTKKYLVTEMNDIVYNPANVKYGAIDRNKFGRGLISPIYVTFTTREDAGFIERIVTSHEFQQKALRFEEGTVTKRQSVNPEDFVLLDILLASNKSEQKKVSVFFDTLDRLITLHQRKCDETKKLKKFMLQKMFPKNGEKNPEIRFAGFTDDWEQRKLGEVLNERSERANGEEELLSVTISNGVIQQSSSVKKNTASEDKSNYKIVCKGDVPYNSMRMWQGAVGYSRYDGIVSPAYTVLIPTEEANGKFFMELFKKETTLQIFKRWSQGLTSDTWNLKYPALSLIQFFIPSFDEQSKIAEYFSTLDHLITLHQRKCDKLKLIKKFKLQNMFPKKG